ncbi:invasion associated locus B family protein [Consotaella aegiceratis]|uniref:invasion associated locus B family protein n=1 Tax=Consotaella aegiceratis TaxID=3097961 RepID=UPI003D80A17D
MFNATSKALAAGFLGAATLAASAGGASAQSAVPTEWFKACTTQGDNKICNTQFTLIADTRQLLTAVNLIRVEGAKPASILQIVVPTGRVIPAGVQMQVDTSAPKALNYSVCFPDRCIAEAPLTDEIVGAMKRGGQMTITSINFQRQPNPIKITLSGFTQAYDGPAQDQSALAERQKELNDALQKQAEERREKFEQAQDAAKSGGGQ